jgi:hypothetical protein
MINPVIGRNRAFGAESPDLPDDATTGEDGRPAVGEVPGQRPTRQTVGTGRNLSATQGRRMRAMRNQYVASVVLALVVWCPLAAQDLQELEEQAVLSAVGCASVVKIETLGDWKSWCGARGDGADYRARCFGRWLCHL